MLSQHLITRPVFDALFENYAFSEANPVSRAMQSMLDVLKDEALEKETASLDKFYASVRERVEGIDNAEGKQKVITELYDKFFKEAFPKMSERLGIVYTPIPIVDFLLLSVEDVLVNEFKSSLSHENVHLIDPFTGTGTFIVRLLQLGVVRGIIKPKDLLRKYQHELHANEIVLLAYYIAAINIEETFHTLQREAAAKADYKGPKHDATTYVPFDGIVLTDTFQLTEAHDYHTTGDEKMFPENNKRVSRQRKAPIRVVVGNPPYSAKQDSENDANQNLSYPILDLRIKTTYAERSNANNKNPLYDSYIRAIRWSSDRIAEQGIVAFVTNGSFIEANSMDGLRACLTEEFTSIYIFNLRGNQRTAGELSRQEGGKIFGSGSRTPVAISILVRNPTKKGNCELFYRDIGDYLTREEKLGIVTEFGSIMGLHRKNAWQRLKPNEQHDWINLRDPAFDAFPVMGDKSEKESLFFVSNYSQGVLTSRDPWCYNFSSKNLGKHVSRTVDFFNEHIDRIEPLKKNLSRAEIEELVENHVLNDAKQISWSSSLKSDLARGKRAKWDPKSVITACYRPFSKQYLYYDARRSLPGTRPRSLEAIPRHQDDLRQAHRRPEGRGTQSGQDPHPLQLPPHPRWHPAGSLRLHRQRQARPRMDHGALPNHHRQSQRHQKRPQRLVQRTQQPPLHRRSPQTRHPRQPRNQQNRQRPPSLERTEIAPKPEPMTAKRKTVPPNDDANREQRVLDGLLATIMETEKGAAWIKAYIEETKNPGMARKRKRHEARREAFFSFLRYLNELPAGQDLPEGLNTRWEKWLRRFEREEIAKLPPKDRAEDRVRKWVKRAWVTTGLNDPDKLQTGRFIDHDQRPSADNHPVAVILTQQKGKWRMPPEQMLAATAHPYVRAFCHSLPPLPDKEAVLGKMRWALDLEGKPTSPESQVSDAASHLLVSLYGDVRECLPASLDRCIPFDQVPEDAPLWKLLNAAIGFGRMLQHQEIYGDGSVVKLLRYGVAQAQACPQREAIEDLMTEYRTEHEEEAKADALLEWIGAKRPYSDDDPIEFPDKRFDILMGIKWPSWNQHVKNVKRPK
jgi:hypothetical protein